jgi:CheY-like chemotaxis protein
VYGIVKQSGGFIWSYSEPGLGSTFKVYLPVQLVAPPRSPPSKPVAPRGGSETVLVVEDEDVVRSMACRGLREHGYTVLEARNGAEALALVEENPGSIHLVVSDVVMPEVGGRELAARLIVLDPTLPVLYMSGYTGEDVVQRGLMDADAPFQQKPFTPDGLARSVRELLDLRVRSRTAPTT